MTGQLAADPSLLPLCTVDEPMRIGALDVGAVAAQLLIVQLEPGRPPLRCGKFKTPTRLAPHCTPDRTLTRTGIDVVVDAITRALAVAREGRVDALYLYATSVIRDAPNAAEVVAAVRQACGVRLSFLSGADESHLTYVAARRWATHALPPITTTRRERMLVLDIGGGTSEIAVGSSRRPELALSLPLGARRLTATYLPQDPPTPAQLAQLRLHVREVLHTATPLNTPPITLDSTSSRVKRRTNLSHPNPTPPPGGILLRDHRPPPDHRRSTAGTPQPAAADHQRSTAGSALPDAADYQPSTGLPGAIDRQPGADEGGLLGVVDRALATSRVFRQLCRLAGRRHRLTVEDLGRCVAMLAPLTAAERVELPGVTRPRAGLILAGAIIAEELLTALNVPYVESCPWGLREGIILDHARTRPLPSQPSPSPDRPARERWANGRADWLVGAASSRN